MFNQHETTPPTWALHGSSPLSCADSMEELSLFENSFHFDPILSTSDWFAPSSALSAEDEASPFRGFPTSSVFSPDSIPFHGSKDIRICDIFEEESSLAEPVGRPSFTPSGETYVDDEET